MAFVRQHACKTANVQSFSKTCELSLKFSQHNFPQSAGFCNYVQLSVRVERSGMNLSSIPCSTRCRKRTSFRCVLLVAALALSTGCGRAVSRVSSNIAASAAGGIADRVIAQPDSTVELLEAELRWMEDNLYRIDDKLETTLLQLESARRDNAMLRLELTEALGENKSRASQDSASFYGEPALQDLTPPVVVDQAFPAPQSPPSMQIVPPQTTTAPQVFPAASSPAASSPAAASGGYDEETQPLGDDDPYNIIDYGTPTPAPIPTPIPNGTRGNEPSSDGPIPTEPLPDGDNGGDPFEDDPEPIEPEPEPEVPNSVKRIELNPRLTGGYNFDKIPGHEGLMVVIEPKDQFGRYVPASGEVIVEVTDPSQRGFAAGRVAKWKFDSLEARQHLRQSAMGKGVHLQLPWPAAPPQNRNLQVKVSYQLANGKTLSANKNVLVELLTSTLVEKANAAGQTWSSERPSTTLSPPKFAPTLNVEETARGVPALWQPER